MIASGGSKTPLPILRVSLSWPRYHFLLPGVSPDDFAGKRNLWCAISSLSIDVCMSECIIDWDLVSSTYLALPSLHPSFGTATILPTVVIAFVSFSLTV